MPRVSAPQEVSSTGDDVGELWRLDQSRIASIAVEHIKAGCASVAQFVGPLSSGDAATIRGKSISTGPHDKLSWSPCRSLALHYPHRVGVGDVRERAIGSPNRNKLFSGCLCNRRKISSVCVHYVDVAVAFEQGVNC